jgi:hypothetical protein
MIRWVFLILAVCLIAVPGVSWSQEVEGEYQAQQKQEQLKQEQQHQEQQEQEKQLQEKQYQEQQEQLKQIQEKMYQSQLEARERIQRAQDEAKAQLKEAQKQFQIQASGVEDQEAAHQLENLSLNLQQQIQQQERALDSYQRAMEQEPHDHSQLNTELGRLHHSAKIQYNEQVQKYLNEELPEAMEWLKDFTEEAKDLGQDIRERVIPEAKIALSEVYRQLKDVQRNVPELMPKVKALQMKELEADGLAKRIRSLPEGDEREELQDLLRTNLEESFDLSQELRSLEAEQVEKELSEMQELLDKRLENRELIIERRYQEVVDDKDPFAW